MLTAAGWEPTVDNLDQTSPFQDKSDCHVFQTLGWHDTSSAETVQILKWTSILRVLGFKKVSTGWNTQPSVKLRNGLYNVTRASIDFRESRKWVNFQFWVNYPLKCPYKSVSKGSNLVIRDGAEHLADLSGCVDFLLSARQRVRGRQGIHGKHFLQVVQDEPVFLQPSTPVS